MFLTFVLQEGTSKFANLDSRLNNKHTPRVSWPEHTASALVKQAGAKPLTQSFLRSVSEEKVAHLCVLPQLKVTDSVRVTTGAGNLTMTLNFSHGGHRSLSG